MDRQAMIAALMWERDGMWARYYDHWTEGAMFSETLEEAIAVFS